MQDVLEEALNDIILSNPGLKLTEYVAAVFERTGIDVSRRYIQRIFKRWGWSWKVPAYAQVRIIPCTNLPIIEAQIHVWKRWSVLSVHQMVLLIPKREDTFPGRSSRGLEVR